MEGSLSRTRPRIGFLPIGRIGNDALQQDYEAGKTLVHRLEAEVVESPLVWDQTAVLDSVANLRASGIDILIQYVLHGMSAVQQTLAGVKCGVPVVLWALPSNYSFPSCASAVGDLRERGIRVRLLLAPSGDVSILQQLDLLARVAYTVVRLRNSRIGTLGGVFPNLSASHYHRDALAEKLGPETVHIPLVQLQRALSLVDANGRVVDEQVARLRSTYDVRTNDELLRNAARFELALQALVNEHSLTALAMECYTELVPLFGINPCLGFAKRDDSYLIACEGDVVAGTNMLMVRYLTGIDPFMGDIYSLQDGILSLVHGAAPACLAANPESVVISEQAAPDSVGLKLQLAMCVPTFPLGEVTLSRLHGRACDRLDLTKGELVAQEAGERVKVYVRLSNPEGFLEHVSGNHYLLIPGDLRPHLKLLGEWLDLTVTEI